MLTTPDNEANVQHNVLWQREHDLLTGQIMQSPEGKWRMKMEPDNKGRSRVWDDNPISNTYHWIWITEILRK